MSTNKAVEYAPQWEVLREKTSGKLAAMILFD
jgi:hypothetical protein